MKILAVHNLKVYSENNPRVGRTYSFDDKHVDQGRKIIESAITNIKGEELQDYYREIDLALARARIPHGFINM